LLHHYIPEFYQKKFANAPDDRLHFYNRKEKKYGQAHPRVLCREHDLYTIDPNGGRDHRIESKYSSVIDSIGADAIRQIQQGNTSHDAKANLALFIAHMLTRSPAFREVTTKAVEGIGYEYLRLGFASEERARTMIQNARIMGVNIDDAEAPGLVEAVRGNHLKVVASEAPFLLAMMQTSETIAGWILASSWELLVAPFDTSFVLCDYPFVLVPPENARHEAGLAIHGAVKYFPLGKQTCIRMSEPFEYQVFNVCQIVKSQVRSINLNIAINSERFIIGSSRIQLEAIVERSGTANAPEPRVSVERVFEDDDRSLLAATLWPRRDFFYRVI